MKVPLSVIIPIKNEAANLPRCLNAIAWADEIWVVDSQSTDGSQEIVAAFAAKVATQKPETGNLKLEGEASSGLRSQTNDHGPRTTDHEAAARGDSRPTAGCADQRSELGSQWSVVSSPSIKLVQFQFNGTWPKKKNWALENLPFKHEWVFILDADEVMPPEAEQEFRDIVTGRPESGNRKPETVRSQVSSLKSPASALPPVGYWINRRFMFMGQWLRHAYYPNWNLRLFKHQLGRYEKLTDVATASGDNEVHEHVIVQGPTGHLKCEMDHYAFPSVDVFIEKHNRYSNWEARVALDRYLQGSSHSLQSREVGTLRKLKQLSQKLPFRPLQRFLYVYVWQRGFLDGRAGWHFARLHAWYEYLCVVKTVELKRRQDRKPES